MTNIVQSTSSKAIVAFVAAAMIFTMFATPAKAQTMEELQAQITALMAQISALQGGATTPAAPATSCAAIPAPLTMGATGANVTALQNFLISAGQVIPAGATGYFGGQTQSALAAWQAANGVSPAVGYYGPITAAAMAAKCVPATTPTEEDEDEMEDEDDMDGGPLMGGEGTLEVDVIVDADVTIDLGDAEEVLTVEVEAVDSDLSISRVDYIFDSRPWLYFDEVNLLVDGEEVASLSRSSDFTEVGGNYRARFSGLDLILREDDMAEVTLELVALDSMAGDRVDDPVEVSIDLDMARATDGAGITDTYGDATTVVVTFLDTFGEGDVKVTEAENSPEAATIVLDESSRTTGVEVLVVDVEAEDSDIEVTDVTVGLSVSASTLATVVNRARLLADGVVIGTKGASGLTASGDIVFDDLEYMIDEDDVVEFSVEIDFNRGDSFSTPITFTVVDIFVEAEDADFAAIDSGVVSIAEAHTLIVDGIVTKVASTVPTASTQTADPIASSTGQYRVRVDVTAVGETVFIPETAVRETWTNQGILYNIVDDAGNVVASTTGVATQSFTRVSGGSLSGGFVRINDGQTATFELYVTFDPATAGQYRVQAVAIGTNTTAAAAITANTLTPSEDFRTPLTNVQ